jgi:hypothetical protein
MSAASLRIGRFRDKRMKKSYEDLAQRLAECFAPLNEAVAAEILAGICEDDSFMATYRFEISAETIRQVAGILAREEPLWSDFRAAVRSKQQPPSWSVLMQHALTVGRWQAQRERLDAATLQVRSPVLRQRFARYVNDVDGALGRRHEACDDGGFAQRLNGAAGAPVIDGLQLGGLMLVLAENTLVWNAFRAAIDELMRATFLSRFAISGLT